MDNNKKLMLLGGHMSTSGGLHKAIERAESVNSSCFQIFVKNNRQWVFPNISDQAAAEFKQKLNDSSIKMAVAHATYLINLASENIDTQKKSIECLDQEIKACDRLGINLIVMHPGSHNSRSKVEAIIDLAKNINAVIEKNSNTNTTLLLETMAGQGSSIGSSFEDLKQVYELVDAKDKIGFCIDTCHIFASGYDISNQDGFDKAFKQFDEILGLEKIKLFHINDSKKELGSKVDRHENILAGKIGEYAFRRIMNDKRFIDTPKIIETPKDDLSEDAKNIGTLIKLVSHENLSLLEGSLLKKYL